METTFPYRLYQVLELMDNKAPSEASIRWGPDGKSFRVQLKQEFCQKIIPKFFESKSLLIDNDFLKLKVFLLTVSKFTSFTRQLNIYGFKQIRDHGPLNRSYHHPCFHRGQEELLHQLVRTPIKTTTSVKKSFSTVSSAPRVVKKDKKSSKKDSVAFSGLSSTSSCSSDDHRSVPFHVPSFAPVLMSSSSNASRDYPTFSYPPPLPPSSYHTAYPMTFPYYSQTQFSVSPTSSSSTTAFSEHQGFFSSSSETDVEDFYVSSCASTSGDISDTISSSSASKIPFFASAFSEQEITCLQEFFSEGNDEMKMVFFSS
jgi:hypothetical protein